MAVKDFGRTHSFCDTTPLKHVPYTNLLHPKLNKLASSPQFTFSVMMSICFEFLIIYMSLSDLYLKMIFLLKHLKICFNNKQTVQNHKYSKIW